MYRAGDVARARATVPAVTLPEWREENEWLLEVVHEVSHPLAQGSAREIVRERVAAAGLPAEAMSDVWRRVLEMDSEIRSFLSWKLALAR